MQFILAFILVLVSALIASRLAPSLGLLAYPGQHRLHAAPTPMVGGIAIAVGIGVLGWSLEPGLLPAMAVIFVIGVLDDRFKLPSWLRFFAQAFALWLMILSGDVVLQDLGELIPETKALLGSWAVPITIFAGIGVINALNMSDGLDGQAGVVVSMALLALLFLVGGNDTFAWLVLAAVLAFLSLNLRIARPRARLFLGDAGSTLLGLILAFFFIKYSQGASRAFPPVTALWLIALPLFDAVTVLLIRPLRGSSPFAADRIHYHHVILAKGLSVNQTLAVIAVGQALSILAGLWMHSLALPDYLQLSLFLFTFSVYFAVVWRATRSGK